MNKKIISLALILATFPLYAANTVLEDEDKRFCLTSREYITTLNYLRAKKEFALPELAAKEIADKISFGCTGAGKRFIQITELLTKAGLDSKSSVESGIIFSKESQIKANTFISIFKEAYESEALDMDLLSATKMATTLAIDYKGKEERILPDFKRITEFCLRKSELDLPKPECAKLATEVTKAGESYDVMISEHFIRLFKFITDEKEAGRTSMEALTISRRIIPKGHVGVTNFIHGYRFAADKKGLGFDVSKALEFAETMANRTLPLETKR